MADRQYLDRHLRLRLTALGDKQFEDFFLHFLNAGLSVTIQRNGHDPELGSFNRWIVEIEQRDREQHRLRHEADMAEFD